jgi:hypothetical protein
MSSPTETMRDWRRERLVAILRNFKLWWLTHDPKHETDRLEVLVEHLLDLVEEEAHRLAETMTIEKPEPFGVVPARGIVEDPGDDPGDDN